MTTCSNWPRSAFTRPRPGDTTTLHLDLLADEAFHHCRQAAHDVAQVEDLGNERLFAAECEELPGQRGGPLARLPDFLRRVVQGTRLEPMEEDVAVAEHDREKVVEVVGHAAREAADRLHLLDLQELGLEPFHFGEVAHDRRNALRFSDRVPVEHQDLRNRCLTSIPTQQRVVAPPRSLLENGGDTFFHDQLRAPSRVHVLDLQMSEVRVFRQPHHSLRGPVVKHEVPLQVG